MQKPIYLKELAHVIVGAGKHKICRAGQQPGNLVRVDVTVLTVYSRGQQVWKLRCGSYVATLKQNPFYFGEPHSFPLRQTEWMRPTHFMEDFTESLLI